MLQRTKVEQLVSQANADPANVEQEPLAHEQRRALNDLYSAAYEELYGLARSIHRRHNLAVSTGTLVNAAWLKLANSGRFSANSKEHFMCLVARVMRHVLVEAARNRNAKKRGGRDGPAFVAVAVDDVQVSCDRDVLALDAALKELERLNPRQAQIVEERFFGGFDETEIADRLKVSLSTVHREWRAAKARLAVQIRRG